MNSAHLSFIGLSNHDFHFRTLPDRQEPCWEVSKYVLTMSRIQNHSSQILDNKFHYGRAEYRTVYPVWHGVGPVWASGTPPPASESLDDRYIRSSRSHQLATD